MTRWALLAGICVAAAALSLSAGEHEIATPALAADCNKIAFPDTAQRLIDGARQGDVICLAPGVFRGPLRLESKTGLTLRGQGHRVTIVAGGRSDALLVFNSRDITFENFTLFYGVPSNAYVWRSFNVNFQNMDVGGGALGIHYDVNSLGAISDSWIYAMDGDGVLGRRGSNLTVEHNWIFQNGGVGVATVGETANTNVIRNIISDNAGPGVFAGQTPCALLPPGFVEVPECYLRNLAAYVGTANVVLDTNVIQSSGSTGIVQFPGTRGTFRNNRVWANELSGLFVWGASWTSEGEDYARNEEHAIEARAYPDPLKYPEIPSGQRIRAVGRINNSDVHDTVVLPETGTLGGGILGQGANMDVTNSRIYRNRGIGVSYVNTSLGRIEGNNIHDNGGSAICVFRAGNVVVGSNQISNNVVNTPGVCRETTP
jgi:hypothetical protein